MKTRNISGRILQAAVALALAAGATGAHADATLDKIKERGTVTIGVLANGGVFGSIDPSTQQLVGWNPDLARELAKGLGVKAELYTAAEQPHGFFNREPWLGVTTRKADELLARVRQELNGIIESKNETNEK